MNVDKVNLNSQRAYLAGRKVTTRPTNFTGQVPHMILEEEINKLNPPILRGINKFRSNIGELQDICINALGTGLLAPIFIKYNPLSKTDEDTRTYTALRQPVSAVLAVATQGVITIPVVRLIKNLANEGYLSPECNMTPFKDKKYIEEEIKNLHPEATKQQLDKYVEAYLKSGKSDLRSTIDSLRNENTVYYISRNILDKSAPGKRIKITKEQYDKLLNATVDDMIKAENTQLERCKGEKLDKRFVRSEFYRTNNDAAQQVIDEMKNKINSTDDIKDIIKFLKDKRKSLKSSKANPQLIAMVQETLDRNDKEIMLKKIDKMQGHIDKYKTFTSTEQVKEAVKASVAERIQAHEGAVDFLKRVKEAIKEGKSVSDIEKMFAEEVKTYKDKAIKFKLADKESRFENKVFAEEVANKLKNLTESHIAGVKRIASLVAALAILPVSCSLLNWIYPRFMDAVFPNLSNKKHNNESKELVDKATKNSEVK